MLTLYKQIFLTPHLICNLINIGDTGNQMAIRSIFVQDRITPSIKKQLPSMLAERLSQLSCNQHMFNNATVVYQEAMQKTGYHNKLKYQHLSSPTIPAKTKKRKRKILWFNPLLVNMLKLILKGLFLIYLKTTFPPAIASNCSTNTVKISYSCMPNTAMILSRHNKTVLASKTPMCILLATADARQNVL